MGSLGLPSPIRARPRRYSLAPSLLTKRSSPSRLPLSVPAPARKAHLLRRRCRRHRRFTRAFLVRRCALTAFFPSPGPACRPRRASRPRLDLFLLRPPLVQLLIPQDRRRTQLLLSPGRSVVHMLVRRTVVRAVRMWRSGRFEIALRFVVVVRSHLGRIAGGNGPELRQKSAGQQLGLSGSRAWCRDSHGPLCRLESIRGSRCSALVSYHISCRGAKRGNVNPCRKRGRVAARERIQKAPPHTVSFTWSTVIGVFTVAK